MNGFLPDSVAVVVGSSGGIGAALAETLDRDGGFAAVHRLARSSATAPLDVLDEGSIAAAAARIGAPVHLVIVATGVLHAPGMAPEKTYRALDAEAMLAAYRVNAIGPALVAKHFLPLLPARGRGVFAALSARVGSIGDNRTGGWHAYRASKAALNMLIRNLAIETARRNPETICIGLHPGTVDTALSRPFQRGVAEGRLFTAAESAARLLTVVATLLPVASGRVLAWDGEILPA